MRGFTESADFGAGCDPFRLIGKDWMAISVGDLARGNAMTASWGGLGVLWESRVAFVFVRPSRYTFEFLAPGAALCLNFFGSGQRGALGILGSESGRDGNDKLARCGLSAVLADNGCLAFAQADWVLECRLLYDQDLDGEKLGDESIAQYYRDGDYHRFYVAKVLAIRRRQP